MNEQISLQKSQDEIGGTTETQSTAPQSWIERLFEVMSGKYGARFADAWRGIDPAVMKKEWARSLGVLTQEQIVRGVQLLDQHKYPPTIPEFIALCKQSTPPCHQQFEKLPKPKRTEEEKLAGLERLNKMKEMCKREG